MRGVELFLFGKRAGLRGREWKGIRYVRNGTAAIEKVQEKIGFVYHHTREKVSVPLMKEVRTEHRNIMTKERWMAEREKNCGKV